ncbi:hypothetical protein [Allorhodopirellula solitaria]|uniref:Uncharacterized protein n=1 Tax=Allorhodopirellula solitaria TaxID=2527987 RepID=A0A5C5XQE5_9BACT|nr:hypothetical protein [Allorhodopirellula solitaria]TWT64819.1 hypothetical protein CA85_36040 [Allorhodopirellula solitaria]
MNRTRCTHHRRGAVALMLVLVLTLLVGTFAISLTSRANQQRRTERQHQAIAALESAIDAARRADLPGESSIRLPLGSEGDRWIIVETDSSPDEPSERYRATQYHNDRPGLSISRP